MRDQLKAVGLHEQAAYSSTSRAAERRCNWAAEHPTLSEEKWRKEMRNKQVGYNGEKKSICHQLTWEQVLPALPPEEHGGCIDCLHWVGNRTAGFQRDTHLLIKPEADVELPKMPGKIHIREGDQMRIADELVRRNVRDWIQICF